MTNIKNIINRIFDFSNWREHSEIILIFAFTVFTETQNILYPQLYIKYTTYIIYFQNNLHRNIYNFLKYPSNYCLMLLYSY